MDEVGQYAQFLFFKTHKNCGRVSHINMRP